jgi:acyl dehydratase
MVAKDSDPRGMYFEEFFPGQKIMTPGRTITEADIVNFAGLSGDFTQIHTNAEFSKNTPFGQRIAHGLLGVSIVSGLAAQTGVMEGTVIAFREIKNWKFIKNILIGDTIHAELEVRSTKELRRVGAGAVDIEINVKNQDDEVLMRGTWTVLMLLRPVE